MNTYYLEQLIAPPYIVNDSVKATDLAPCVLTIGNFDGVHLGHQAMLAKVRALADEQNLNAAVMIF